MTINLRHISLSLDEKYIYALSIFYIAFFFPFIAIVNYFLNADSNIVSVIYRISALAIGLIIVGREIVAGKYYTPLYFWVFIGFWIFYFIHYFIDLFFYELYLVPENGLFYYLTQGFLITFFNFLAIYFAAQKVDLNQFTSILNKGFLSINLFIFVLILIKSDLNFQNLVQSRFEIESSESGTKYLNPILISSYAVFSILLLNKTIKNKVLHFILYSILLFNLFFSASLSPTLGLVLILLIFGLYKFYKNVLSIILPLLFVITLTILIILFFDTENLLILQRVLDGGEGQSSIERKIFIGNAFKQIQQNFFWGTHYFTTIDNSSPHNIFIDVVLSTGLFGLFLFIIPIFVFLKTIIINLFSAPIFQIAFISFFISQFSGYVFGSSDFFAFVGIIFALRYNESSLG